ncbi:conserved hypothetical protein [uncultured Mycobacterium sp.]|uniref:Uncharacterized protein n=1 Tax=uncultured Mycobacterium sp. TaxID=171292 RepID=A0A1Y5P2P9_9MYCO|nr:conserved hypothetical protein [uncultured Mycobacterium sp.]
MRKWYHHDPARFDEFARGYRAELTDSERAAALRDLQKLVEQGTLALLTALRDADRSEAAVLADLLNEATSI